MNVTVGEECVCVPCRENPSFWVCEMHKPKKGGKD